MSKTKQIFAMKQKLLEKERCKWRILDQIQSTILVWKTREILSIFHGLQWFNAQSDNWQIYKCCMLDLIQGTTLVPKL